MGVKTNRTSSLSGNRSVQHGTKKHKKKGKKNKNVKTCYLTNTNLTNTCKKNRGEVSFIFHASHITYCLSAKNVAIQFENVEKTNHCLRICQETLHL